MNVINSNNSSSISPLDKDRDIKRAYNCQHINANYYHFHVIHSLVHGSDRSPRAVNSAAKRIGMVIPAKLRQNIDSYNYFIDQFRYYLNVRYFEDAEVSLDNLDMVSDSILLNYLSCHDNMVVSSNAINYDSRLMLQDKVRQCLLRTHLIPLDWFGHNHYYSITDAVYNQDQLLAAVSSCDIANSLVSLADSSTYVVQPPACRLLEWQQVKKLEVESTTSC